VADLPGLIEGASEGAGLGTRFLRHVERTRLLVHLIDTSDMAEMDPVKAYEIIVGELKAFSGALTEKPMIVVATKLDATTDRTKIEELRGFCAKSGLEFHAISAATGEGVKELVRGMADALEKIPKEEIKDEALADSDSPPEARGDYVNDSVYEGDHDSEADDEEGPAVSKHP
jgi:GTP-binding protein